MLLRRVARPLLAGIFIQGGIAELRALEPHVDMAGPVIAPVAEKAPEILPPVESPPDPATLVKLDAVVKIGAGTLLALGKAPRLASAALAASLVPTTIAGHAFWNEEDEAARSQQKIQFFKNLGLLGGLMIASADTAGKPSLAWRGKRAARLATAEAERKIAEVSGTAGRASGTVSGKTSELAGKASGVTSDLAGKASGTASALAGVAAGSVSALAARAAAAGSELTNEAEKKAAKLQRRAAQRADKLRKTAAKRAAKLSKQAEARAAALTQLASAKSAALADRAETLGKAASGMRDDVAGKAASVGGSVSSAAKDASGKVKSLAR
jgi:uncharacterized membrane protein YphA (DoxX/SURF4 family)